MRTSNGPGVVSNHHSNNPAVDARHASSIGNQLTESEAEFWYLIECQGYKELAHSLRTIHDLALYHSNVPFDTAEKSALFDVKVLWEAFEKLGQEA